jgi:hypothetical protein
MPAFYVIWQQNGVLLQGVNPIGGSWTANPLVFPVSFPGQVSIPQSATLRSSARDTNTLETLVGVKVYLTGLAADIAIVQSQWPYLGNAFTPARPELNGGVEISFDQGRSYTRFSNEVGLEATPSTWITLPAISVGLNGIAGQLGPFDQAHMLVRFNIPQGATLYKVPDIRIAADFDII